MIIGRLVGEVAGLGTDHLLVDVNGVGYVCMAGTRLLSRTHAGEKITVHVETRVTENSITLFGFGTDEERAWFVRLQDVHGVAGKAAMAILDAITPAELMDAIALGDAKVLERAKGVGKKLAERIVHDLSGKPPPLGRFGTVRSRQRRRHGERAGRRCHGRAGGGDLRAGQSRLLPVRRGAGRGGRGERGR
jgi:Holliday junction DNA helicase RuvA